MQSDQKKPGKLTLLEQDLAEVMREQTARLDPDVGLDRFMAAVKAHPKRAPKTSWWQRMNEWLGGIGFTPALASVVVVVQVGVLAALLTNQPGHDDATSIAQYRGADVRQEQTPDLKLTISPDADFASLAILLRSNGCKIVAGPTESGEIWVVVEDKNRLVEVRAILSQSRLIDDVSVK
jgi:hypothetical protein